jgi:hypothetical protein
MHEKTSHVKTCPELRGRSRDRGCSFAQARTLVQATLTMFGFLGMPAAGIPAIVGSRERLVLSQGRP